MASSWNGEACLLVISRSARRTKICSCPCDFDLRSGGKVCKSSLPSP